MRTPRYRTCSTCQFSTRLRPFAPGWYQIETRRNGRWTAANAPAYSKEAAIERIDNWYFKRHRCS